MRLVFAILAAPLLGTAATADPMRFAGPYGSIIEMPAAACPAGHVCVDSAVPIPGSGDAARAILPDWAVSQGGLPDKTHPLTDYQRGMSDKIIVDICNYCDCCIITQGDPGQKHALDLIFKDIRN